MTDAPNETRIEIDVVTYTPLAQHTARGGLFLVTGASLADVASAIAQNRTKEVEAYIEGGELKRPSAEEHERFSKDPEAYTFSFVIVQPFVLAQLQS
jgi:hypothetical protein